MVPDLVSSTRPIASLGQPLQEFHLRQAWLHRWGNLALAVTCLTGAAVVLVFGSYQAYMYYYRFGPAILWKTVEIPVLLFVALLASGLVEARAAYLYWNRKATLYENGFTYQDQRGIHIWHWSEIQQFRYIIYRNFAAFFYTGNTHHCVVSKDGKKSQVLNDELENVDQLASVIRKNVFPGLYTRSIDQLRAGKRLEFGPLTLSLAGGIGYHHKAYSLTALESAGTFRGVLQLTLKNGNGREKIKFRASHLLNLDILLALLADIKAGNFTSQPRLQPS